MTSLARPNNCPHVIPPSRQYNLTSTEGEKFVDSGIRIIIERGQIYGTNQNKMIQPGI
jgi:hypothetical protein